MSKRRNLAGFGEVASQPGNNNDNDNINVNNNIESLFTEKEKPILVGVYFDPELAKTLDEVSKGRPKGAKSKIVNEAVRKLFQEMGIIQN